jgi:prepilin-type processing-associated H-X9-DG protein
LHAQPAPSRLGGITLQTHDFNTGQPHSFTSDGNTATIADGWTEPHRTSHLNGTMPVGGNLGMLDGHVEWRNTDFLLFWW